MQLGKNISDLRKEKGLSQEKLAEQINVTRQTISNWELGETSPNPEQLILLSKALGKSVDELLDNAITNPVSKDKADVVDFKKIRKSFAIVLGAIAGVWSYSANRFRYDEILMFIAIGVLIGYCLSVVYQSTLRYLKRK